MTEIIEDWEDGIFDGWWNNYTPTLDPAYAYASGYGARFYAHSTAVPPTQSSSYEIHTNTVNHDMTGHNTLDFWIKEIAIGDDAGGWGGYFRVRVVGGPSYTFDYLDSPDNTWKLISLDVSALSGNHVIYIEHKAVWGDTEVWIDEIVFDYVHTYTLSGTISDEWGNPVRGVDINVSNGTTYTTASDENGAYSQVVDSDTYNITVSKLRSTFHNITYTSVAITSDTTKNITMITDKMTGKQNAQKGMSIIGGISLGRS